MVQMAPKNGNIGPPGRGKSLAFPGPLEWPPSFCRAWAQFKAAPIGLRWDLPTTVEESYSNDQPKFEEKVG